jgi:hypothetical protein
MTTVWRAGVMQAAPLIKLTIHTRILVLAAPSCSWKSGIHFLRPLFDENFHLQKLQVVNLLNIISSLDQFFRSLARTNEFRSVCHSRPLYTDTLLTILCFAVCTCKISRLSVFLIFPHAGVHSINIFQVFV